MENANKVEGEHRNAPTAYDIEKEALNSKTVGKVMSSVGLASSSSAADEAMGACEIGDAECEDRVNKIPGGSTTVQINDKKSNDKLEIIDSKKLSEQEQQ